MKNSMDTVFIPGRMERNTKESGARGSLTAKGDSNTRIKMCTRAALSRGKGMAKESLQATTAKYHTKGLGSKEKDTV